MKKKIHSKRKRTMLRSRSYDCLTWKLRKTPSLTVFRAAMRNLAIATPSMNLGNGTAPSRGYRSARQLWGDTECTCKAKVDCSWRKVPRFQVHSVSDHHCLAERQPRLGAVPFNEFIDCMAIATLGIGARKAVNDGVFRNFKIRQS